MKKVKQMEAERQTDLKPNNHQRSIPFTISFAPLCPEPYAPLRENGKQMEPKRQMDLTAEQPSTNNHQ
jgi:hypothetical protein